MPRPTLTESGFSDSQSINFKPVWGTRDGRAEVNTVHTYRMILEATTRTFLNFALVAGAS